MQQVVWVLIALCLWQYSSAICFREANGVRANPCQCLNFRCDLTPASHHTIKIHSQIGSSPGAYSFTAIGRDFRNLQSAFPGGPVGSLCLGEGVGNFTEASCRAGFTTLEVILNATAPDTQILLLATETFPPTPAAGELPWNNLGPDGIPMELLGPIPLLLTPATGSFGPIFTGFFIEVEWNCNDGIPGQTCADRVAALGGAPYINTATAPELAVLGARTTCCRQNFGVQNPLIGTCLNPEREICCGVAIDRFQEKCCNAARQATAFLEDQCRCSIDQQDNCPASESCCTFSRFSNLVDVIDEGRCFDANSRQCCDDGSVYQPGVEQCCPINGVQSANVPCPCEADTDCPENNGRQFLCCQQTAPALAGGQCTVFANYPFGSLPGGILASRANAQTVRCNGACFDPAFQTCCNGVFCRREFERCCNASCCNTFGQTCIDAVRPGLPGNRFHPGNFRIEQEGPEDEFDSFDHNVITFATCSVIEHLDPINVFWIFLMPITLALFTLFALGLVLLAGARMGRGSLDFRPIPAFLGALLAIFAIVQVILAVPLFFSPLYKYGIFVAAAGIIHLLIAGFSATSTSLALGGASPYAPRLYGGFAVAALSQIAVLILITQPFAGNPLLNPGCVNVGIAEQLKVEPSNADRVRAAARAVLETDPASAQLGGTNAIPVLLSDDDVLNVGHLETNPLLQRGDNQRLLTIDPQQPRVQMFDPNDREDHINCRTIFTGGIITIARELYRHECVDFYDYFLLDPGLRDIEREDNPEVYTFGYCSSEWAWAILFICGCLITLAFLLIAADIFAAVAATLAARRGKAMAV